MDMTVIVLMGSVTMDMCMRVFVTVLVYMRMFVKMLMRMNVAMLVII
jgi:hypothetical protein